jgi:hypothetical protein
MNADSVLTVSQASTVIGAQSQICVHLCLSAVKSFRGSLRSLRSFAAISDFLLSFAALPGCKIASRRVHNCGTLKSALHYLHDHGRYRDTTSVPRHQTS